MKDFTEEEAKDKLEELGFRVMDAREMDTIGWSIEPNGEAWGVWEIHEHRVTKERTRMSLSGRLPDPVDCLEWLAKMLAREDD